MQGVRLAILRALSQYCGVTGRGFGGAVVDLMPSSRVGGVVDRVGFGDLDAVAWKFES